jgi:hypothetical protein
MTEPPDSLDPLDAAASATLDGVATADERALLDGAADGGERLAAHRRVADLVGTAPTAQAAGAGDAAILAALAAADDAADDGDDGDDAPVVPLSAVPRGRSSARWLAPVAAVAAALLLVVGIAGALRTGEPRAKFSSVGSAIGDGGGAAAPAQRSESGQADQSQSPPQAALGAAAGTAGPLDGGDVGKVLDPADLAQRIAEALDGSTSSNTNTVRNSAAPRTDVAQCISKAASVSPVPLAGLRYIAVGSYQGTRVVVLAFDRPDVQARILLFLNAKTCELVTDQDF